ncbi:MAG: ABC transporter substrate-binding protein [Chthoniobacterales bacterium]|nr:ABC transporter substrate-binding protein [Chthoniobacterales bacterium]
MPVNDPSQASAKFMSFFPSLSASVLVSAVMFLPLASAFSSGEIPVGEFTSLTGGSASFGQSSHKGTALAVEEINAAGGVLGKKIRLITEDDQSQAGQPATIVRKLISQDHVVAILGEVASSKTLEAAPICQQNQIPMITPASTNPKVTEVGDHVFRICFIDPFQGTVISKFARARGWNRIAILTDAKQDYSVGLTECFTRDFVARGGEIVREQKYSSGDKDFKAQLTSIKAAQPDAIFVPGYYGEVSLIAKQARLLGIKVPLLGGDGWVGDSLLKVAGKSLDGCFFSAHFSASDKSERVQNFVAKYQAKYGVPPDDMSALGYDSAMILADAIRRAGTTEAAPLRDAIAATKDFSGVTGLITLDEKRNASKPAVILTIENGGFHFVETVTP